jgi:hypothetical protein
MGLEYTVRFSGGSVPGISRVVGLLADHNFPVQVRMVDGELTMPDESPPDGWKEVRLGTPSGMVTLSSHGQEIRVVTWGNANETMQRAWNAVTWAVARAGDGEIILPGGPQRADAFRASVSVPEDLR